MFATTTLLLPMSKLGMCPQTLPLARSVEMAVELLEAMDESIVARKSVDIISHYLREFRASNNTQPVATSTPTHSENTDSTFVAEPGPGQPGFDIPVCDYVIIISLWFELPMLMAFRNGRMVLGSLTTRLTGLRGFLMI